MSKYPLYKSLCKYLIDSKKKYSQKANISVVLKSFDAICTHSNIVPNDFLVKMNGGEQYLKYGEIEVETTIGLTILKTAIGLNNDLSKKCIDFEKQYLDSLPHTRRFQ